jgi:hypothetical protein
MRFFSLVASAVLAGLALASPLDSESTLEPRTVGPAKCISYHTADKLVHDFIKIRTPGLSLLQKQKLANHILADNYADRSQSVDWLSNTEVCQIIKKHPQL